MKIFERTQQQVRQTSNAYFILDTPPLSSAWRYPAPKDGGEIYEQDEDVETRTLTVSKSAGRLKGEVRVTQPKTANSVRTIVLPKETVDLLVQEHARHPHNPVMFPSPVRGRMYVLDCVGRLHKTLMKKAGLTENVTLHGLRHTYATLVIQNGVDAKTVSSILGHYSAGFTLDTYTHVTGEMQEEAADRMGHFIAQAV